MSITAEQIKGVVAADDDFGHEMRVGNLLNTLNYGIRDVTIGDPVHGEAYEDPKLQKTRQFDFRCQLVAGRQNISLAVECKNLNPDLPLVICGRARTDRESCHSVISHETVVVKTSKVRGSSSIYKPHDFVGKSVLRLKTKERKLCSEGDSEIYDRWAQALASSHDLVLDAARKPNSITFIMPMVVVPNGSLWTVCYNGNGDIEGEPKQVNQCEFHVAHKIGVYNTFYLVTHIHFLTLDGLKETITKLAIWDNPIWGKIFSADKIEYGPTS